VFAVLYRLHRDRARNGSNDAYATDPVCSMQVEKGERARHVVVGGREAWFCSDRCRDRFVTSAH